jgi:glycine/D-amino acid oxidase-like deaminating enzyme
LEAPIWPTPLKGIVICEAGIAGIAAAYHLAVKHGDERVTLVEAENPLSMTSDKSTEAYRNWWPGPDPSQTGYMNHSIDLIEERGNREISQRLDRHWAEIADIASPHESDHRRVPEPSRSTFNSGHPAVIVPDGQRHS